MKNTAGFDTSTLIYIALAVIAAIASAFQKKQEKKEAYPEAEKESNWPELFDEKEEDYPEEKVFEKPIPVKIVTSENDAAFRAKSMETYVENELFVPAAYVYEDVIKMTEIGDVNKIVQAEKFEIDMKKAIIYSEIIQRKY